MKKYAQLWADSFGNLPPVVRALATGLDEAEAHLERVREALGFGYDWSPSHDRRQRTGVSSPVLWAEKAASMNGMGDLRALVEEMCNGMDTVSLKLEEATAKIMARSSLGTTNEQEALALKKQYEAARDASFDAPRACPQCGKTGRGLAMHMKSCAGKAA